MLRKKNIPGVPECVFIDSSDAAALVELRRPDRVNLIFGAGQVGGAALVVCRDLGITITAFCDNDPAKTIFCDLPVLSPAVATSQHPAANFLIAVVAFKTVAAQLAGLGVQRVFSVGFLTDATKAAEEPHKFGRDFWKHLIQRRCLAVQRDLLAYPEEIGLGGGVNMVITERCSLKCLNCANLMQYYHHPKNHTVEQVIAEIDALCACVDSISEMRIIGGEPLMHPEFHRIVSYAAAKEQVGAVGIFTNGTLVPRDDQWLELASRKIYFNLSDYGCLSAKKELLIQELERRGINGHNMVHDSWGKWRLLAKCGRGEAELRHMFRTCLNSDCLTLLDGRLFRCEHAANGVKLGVIPDTPENCLDLRPILRGEGSPRDMGRAIWAFVNALEFLPACDHCLGYDRDSEKVKPAEQYEERLPLPK